MCLNVDTRCQHSLLRMAYINMTNNSAASKAIEKYHAATSALREVVEQYPELFPKSSIGPGIIAEYDSAIYLKKKYYGCKATFGHGSQRGWDIVVECESVKIRFQVKCVDENSSNRVVRFTNKSFDQLIILSLGDFFVPSQAYLFDDVTFLKNVGSLSVPSATDKRKFGSTWFRTNARNISKEFWASME